MGKDLHHMTITDLGCPEVGEVGQQVIGEHMQTQLVSYQAHWPGLCSLSSWTSEGSSCCFG